MPSLIREDPAASEQLSPCATILEPVLSSPGAATIEHMCCNSGSPCALKPLLHNKGCHRNKKPARCNQRAAHACHSWRKACTVTKT